MNTGAAISVIVSSCNRAGYLSHTLGMLSSQQCEASFEVIVIDNASTDDTPAVLEEWCRRDSRFRAGHEPRPGHSRGKNAGIRMARGTLLLFTDDDMRIAPGWVQSYHDFFARRTDPRVLAGGPIVPVPHDLGEWPGWLDPEALADAGLLNHRDERRLGRFEYVWGGNMAIPRTLFDELGFWNEGAGLQDERKVTGQDSQFFEDTEFQDRLRASGGATWFCPGATVHHRVNRGAVTPRRIAATAFARGRNAVWASELPVWNDVALFPRRNMAVCMLALSAHLFRWGGALILFRLSGRRGFFEGARRAAFASGQWLDSMRAGRRSVRLFRGAGRIAFLARSVFQRLTPDIP